LKTAHYILYVTLPALFFSCAKQAPQPNAAVLVPGPTPKVDYRDKFIGTYQGRNTDWQNVQGVTTTWIADSNLTDVYTKSMEQDSVIISQWLGSFTISSTGTSVKQSWTNYQTLTFRGDSVYYSYSDWSALGGSHGNMYNAKRMND
jgi:hypothetical protein